jgi:radical SAM protein with 4Fe4S-binding SPASM domain
MRLARHGREFLERRLEPSTPPLRLWIEITSRCNLSCPACCNRKLSDHERRDMDEGLLDRLCAQVPGLGCQVSLFHRGEPLLHPRFDYWITRFRAAGATVRLHTNATLLDQERAQRLAAAEPEFVTLSLDTLHAYRYAQARQGARLDETMAGVERLLAARTKARAKRMRVSLLLMGRQDWGEEEKARIAKLKGLGLERVVVRSPHNWGGAVGQSPAPSRRKPNVCTFPWYALVVLSDGRVCPCPQDVHGSLALGQAGEQGLMEIWRSALAWQLRQHQASHQLERYPVCLACDRIMRPTFLGLPREHLKNLLRESIVRPSGPREP